MGECMHSRATDCSAKCCLECRFLRCEPSIQRLIKWPFSAGTKPLLLKYRFCFPQSLATWTNPHGIGGYKWHCVELRGIYSRTERACVAQCACICMLILLLCVCVLVWMGVILYPFDCGLVLLCFFSSEFTHWSVFTSMIFGENFQTGYFAWRFLELGLLFGGPIIHLWVLLGKEWWGSFSTEWREIPN